MGSKKISLKDELSQAFNESQETTTEDRSSFMIRKMTLAGEIAIIGSIVIFLFNLPYVFLNYGQAGLLTPRIQGLASTFTNFTSLLDVLGVVLIILPIITRSRREAITRVERVIFSVVVFFSVFAVFSNLWSFIALMPNPFSASSWHFKMIENSFSLMPKIVTYLEMNASYIVVIFLYGVCFLLAQSLLRLRKIDVTEK
jgi:hypothetical protein